MKVLVIFAHPFHESFNHALLESFDKGVKEGGNEVEVIDLYKDDFDPVLRKTRHGGEHKPQVKKYQDKIKEADWLAFIFPIFWYRSPAIMEGFFDQVFDSGFAFKYKKVLGGRIARPIGLLPVKKAVVIETYGGPGWFYKLFFFRIPWQRFKAVLKFCGIKKFIHHPCYSVQHTKKKMLSRYLADVHKIGKGLK